MKHQLRLGWLALSCAVFGSNVFGAEGRTPGQFSVSSLGAAQYTIPIWAPPGPHGIQPQISLNYNSQAGIGPLGIGWSLGGLGAITRCNQTVAQNGTAGPVALSVNDSYCINGNLLRLTSGTYGTAGSTYQTEIADFSNITASGSAGSGPGWFTVQGRDGLTYFYGHPDANGNGANSQVLATNTTTANVWLLSKVSDRAGNNYVINYTLETGIAVPHQILWTPVSLGSASYTYTMQLNYSTNAVPSSTAKYVAGTTINNPALLSSIEILSGSTVLKDYFLGYQASSTTGRDELITVSECADSAQSNCFSVPTKMTYQTTTKGVSTSPTSVLSSSGALLTARYDLNGDGIPDLVYDGGATLYVAFGSASGGYGTPINSGISAGALIGRVTGGKQDGLLAVNGTTWWYYTWNGTSFSGTSAHLTYDSANSGFELADINGDGLPDLVKLVITSQCIKMQCTYVATVYTVLNTSTATSPSFSTAAPVVGYVASPIESAELITPNSQYGKLRSFDFNGDGRDDVVLYVIGGSDAGEQELISNGSTFTSVLVSQTSPQVPLFVNWNDDKCTDMVLPDYGTTTIYIAGCNNSVATTYVVSGVPLAALDWDGDGRTDLLVVNGTTIGAYLSTGTGLSGLLSSSVPYNSSCQYVTMSARGDGLDDLGCWSQSGNSPISYYPHNAVGQPPDLLLSVADGYGNSASPIYSSITAGANYTNSNDAVYPYQNYVGPFYEVDKVTFSDPSNQPSGTYYQQYYYSGAWINLQGRGFGGFESVQVYDSRNQLWDKRSYDLTYPYTGMLLSDVLSQDQAGATPVNSQTNTLLDLQLNTTPGEVRDYPYVSTALNKRYELGGAKNGLLISTTNTTYSAPSIYGNFPSIATTVTDNDSGSPYYNEQWSTTTASSFTPDNGTNWCLDMPTEVDTTNTAPGSSITRHIGYTPDYVNCRQTQKIVESGSAYQVTEAMTYDSFGNLYTDTVTGTGMSARQSTIIWGTTGQFPISVKNALGQTTMVNFDSASGKQLSQTDPNNITISWTYDPFQRKNLETRPDNTTTTWAYNSCATAGCVNSNNKMTVVQTRVNTDNSVLRIDNTYLDALDRTLVTSGQMLNGAYDRNEVQYDNLGNVHVQFAPCTFVGCASYATTNTFDVLNRLTKSQRPESATVSTLQYTNYSYQGRTTTVTDAQSKVTTQISMVTGNLGQTKDHNGYYINFNRDAFGSLLSTVDSLSNTLTTAAYKYGISPFVVSTTDMDLGNRIYTVDPLGEVTGYTDANNQNFSALYDALSRPTSRTEPGLTTTWTWGTTAASHNIGQLAGVSSVATAGTYSESYTYDSVGRRSNKTITLPTDGTPPFDYAYSATTGLLSTLTYPQSFPTTYRLTVGYTYQYGILQQMFDSLTPSTIWWQANAMNARGQITQETTSALSTDPQLVSNKTYDAVTGWLGTSQTGVSGGSALQNESYLHDLVGNVTQRQNNNAGLTENVYYDNLYRLDHTTLGSTTNLQMCYDNTGGACSLNLPGMGNITSRSDVASGTAWTYDPTHKHQVTQAGSGGYAYLYDANGNVTARNGSTIGFTSYNYPAGVSTATESATFDYGPNHQRWRMVYTGPSGSETTFYASPLFEKVYVGGGGEYRYYLYAGNRPVMVIRRNTASQVYVESLLLDHQGSVASIVTDSTGVSDVNESFTAYGSRREASTWSGAPTNPELTTMNGVTREGYTFQTVLGSMGLNHMNGRIEDSVTGRFLSGDPVVPDVGNTQSYNRYGYVNNNPVTYIDPTGFDDCYSTPDGAGWYCSYGPPEQTPSQSLSVDTLLPPITVPGVRPGDIVTQFNPGGFTISSPNGDIQEIDAIGQKGGGASSHSSSTGSPLLAAMPQSQQQPTQCINSDGTIGNDSPGNLPNGNLRTVSLNLEGYIGFGFTFQFGGFYDRTTGNYGLFDTFGLGGGLGGSASVNVGTASNLSSFQGITGQVEAGVGPIAGTYVFNANNPLNPVGYSGGVGANLLGVLPVPAAGNVSRTFTNILTSNLPRCH